MYPVGQFIELADQSSDDDLERIEDQNDEAEEATDNKNDEAEETTENKDDEGSAAKKVEKKVRKPSNRPKLDVERLKGPRGLATIETLFNKVQFQGDGHEQEDLHATMRTLHYWCHRLFPKYSFDDCLEHLEKLGSKKSLITLKKKILFDLLDDDQPVVDDEDNINPETQEAINEFDLLLQQQEPIRTLSQQQRPVTPERIELTDEQKEMMERNRLLAVERRKARLAALQQKQAQNDSLLQISSEFTDEQKALIERNRQIALEKRRARNNISINSSLVPSSQGDSSTSAEKPDFNELVDSFFPPSNDDNNPGDNTQKSGGEDDVDLNDLIEEINPTEDNQIEKSVEVNNEMNVDESVDINNLLEKTSENNTTEIDNQKQVEDNQIEKSVEINNGTNIDINNLLEETIENNTTVINNQKEVQNNQMDVDKNTEDNQIEKPVEINNETNIDINNLLEETTTVIDNQKEVETNQMDVDKNTDSFDINSTREDTTANLLETE